MEGLNSMEPMVVIKDLKKVFSKKNALQSITCSVKTGEAFGLSGPHSSGKSVLLKILAGLVKPTSGQIKIFGKDLAHLTVEEKRKIYFVAAESSLYEYMTVLEIVKFSKGFYPNWDAQRCDCYLRRFCLPETEKIKNFSLGMRSQLALILALAAQPSLLLLDEPFSGLDPDKRMDLVNLLLEDYLGRKGRSMIISTNYLEELERLSSKIGFLQDGYLIRTAPTSQLQGKEKLIRVNFKRQPPAYLFEMPGVRRVEREGRRYYLFTIVDNFTEIYESCAKVPHIVLDVYHKNMAKGFQDYGSDSPTIEIR